MKYQIPRGLFDILPAGENIENIHLWQYIEKTAKEVSLDFGFKEIRTPIFERAELFIKSSGETSDIIKKEMYTFKDRKGRLMSLRPEGTAPVMRAFIEKNLHTLPFPQKFYYIGPMFRYDRPQKGRYRQHHQFGVEYIGVDSIYAEVEVIDLLLEFYKRLGLKNISLTLNSIGDLESKENYKKALKEFLKPHLKELSEDSKTRFDTNPLRILDSKEEKDIEILKKAPSILNFLNKNSKEHFENLKNLLNLLKIPYLVDDKLVRGLDYYNYTVFEILTNSKTSQNSLGGGGRYSHLLKNLGGPDLPGIGFGTGIERIIQKMMEQNIKIEEKTNPFVYFIPLNEETKKLSFSYVTELRHLKIPTEINLKLKKLQKALKLGNSLKTKYVVILGEDEITSKKVLIKDMEKREQKKVDLDKLKTFIENLWENFKNV
jgi:histidyl-tRNA synthetase